MGKTQVFSVFMALISIAVTASGQYADIKYYPDSANYYPSFWQKAVDSLSKEWIWNKIEKKSREASAVADISSKENKDKLLKESGLNGLRVTARTSEILKKYEQNGDKTDMAFALYEHYRPVFAAALKKENLPSALSYLPFALSAMNNKIRSYTGGAGFWQLPYSWGRKYALQIDSYVDERLDAEKESAAAAKTLARLYQIYGNWPLTLAAYTCGPANVNKAIYRNGDQVDFYLIYSSLPYFGRDVNDALAASILFAASRKHDYLLNYNPPTDTVEVSKRLHFTQVADILKLDIDEIRFLNPVYKYDIVPAINRVYKILLPQGNLEKFNLYEDSIYSYKDSLLFSLHQRVILPPPPKGRHWAKPAREEIPENSTLVYYHIKSGDNLGFVADWFDVSITQLEDWNNIYNPRRIQIGKKLKIYVPKNKASYYRKIDKMSFSQKQKLAGVSSSQRASKPAEEVKLGKDFFWYTVKEGESPYIIAKRYPGISADDILRWNNIKDPRKIRPGTKLKIKKMR